MRNTLIILLTLCSLSGFAQRDSNSRMDSERIKAAKVAFLTEKLNLDSETAQQFWPIYNEFETAKDELNKQFFNTMKNEVGLANPRKAMEEISEAQAEQMVKLMFEKRAQELKIEMDYIAKVGKVLSAKQTLMVSQFDAEFRRTLMRKFSEESRERRKSNDND